MEPTKKPTIRIPSYLANEGREREQERFVINEMNKVLLQGEFEKEELRKEKFHWFNIEYYDA